MEVLVVSKSFIVREALEIFFRSEFKGYNVKGMKELKEFSHLELSKVKLMFVDMEDDMFDDISYIKSIFAHIKVIVLDKLNNKDMFLKLIKNDIDGYISDISEKEDLIYMVKRVIDGKKYYELDLLQNLIFDKQEKDHIKEKNLTNRENEVLKKVGEGLTNKEIATELYVTEHTIKKHITNILSKLDLRNRKELIIYSKENMYIS